MLPAGWEHFIFKTEGLPTPLALQNTLHVLAKGSGLHFHIDSHFCEVGGDLLVHGCHMGSAGAEAEFEDKGKAIGVTRFSQQSARFVRIVGVRFQCIVPIRISAGRHLVNNERAAIHYCDRDSFFVDGVVQSTTHADILEGRLNQRIERDDFRCRRRSLVGVELLMPQC